MFTSELTWRIHVTPVGCVFVGLLTAALSIHHPPFWHREWNAAVIVCSGEIEKSSAMQNREISGECVCVQAERGLLSGDHGMPLNTQMLSFLYDMQKRYGIFQISKSFSVTSELLKVSVPVPRPAILTLSTE